ncbi:potassium channel family protein [Shouchella shacheensis]|uniref:potassium channel family protein n=1 Tax=Shouchella shacheensis TaxID=1649580 RepID=UPI00074048B0|nr:potassium channel family protein [Shouchella shacheensis]
MIITFIKKILEQTINIQHWKLILGSVFFIALSSFIVYLIEPKEFRNLFNAFWYVMTTVSQVGFGDYIPTTVMGRLYTVLLYLVGVGFFAIIVAKWVDLLNKYEELKEAEILVYTKENHIVMINWSQKTNITIDEILGLNQNIDIVLIDQMNNSPIKHDNIHYIQGNATKTDILQKANILHAKSICIFSPDDVVDKMAGDGKTILIASTIKHTAKQQNRNLYIVAELLEEDHITNSNQDCIDKFIISNKPFSHLMATTALYNDMAD